MILSGGQVHKSALTVWQGTPATWPGWGNLPFTGNRWASYSEIYRQQLWVSTVVNKLAMGEARLPLKVYEHHELNRPQAPDHPYARLLAKPNDKQSRFFFWLWTVSTFDVFGEAFLAKIRDHLGRPVQLVPLHPTAMHEEEEKDGEVIWRFQNGNVRVDGIRNSDLVHPKTYNPDSTTRGMSRLEPLRRTLEFEDAAQRAQSSFWSRGARPGTILKHKGNLSQPAADRLKLQWNSVAAGADNVGTTVVLEEGMEPEKMTLSAEEAQYIESRKLNREEVCGAYDVPPPAVHILDRATFSNITEQLRSLYRDTHAPRLQLFEGILESELRGAVRPGASDPDFGDDVYAEFLLDEVLRGDFEARADAYAKADYMTMAEKRRAENLPFVEGTDRIMVNLATAPLNKDEEPQLNPAELATALQKIYLAVGPVISSDEAREILNRAGAGLTGPAPIPATNPVAPALRQLMGRLSRYENIGDVNVLNLTEGLGDAGPIVIRAYMQSLLDGDDVPAFRRRLQGVAT